MSVSVWCTNRWWGININISVCILCFCWWLLDKWYSNPKYTKTDLLPLNFQWVCDQLSTLLWRSDSQINRKKDLKTLLMDNQLRVIINNGSSLHNRQIWLHIGNFNFNHRRIVNWITISSFSTLIVIGWNLTRNQKPCEKTKVKFIFTKHQNCKGKLLV